VPIKETPRIYVAKTDKSIENLLNSDRGLPKNIPLKQRKVSYNVSENGQEESEICRMLPMVRKRDKCTTISNFLQRLQIDSKDERESSHEAQSEIISIVDLKYNESFYSESEGNIGKRINIVWKKSQARQLMASMRESVGPLRE
jgi:hypothetical protein